MTTDSEKVREITMEPLDCWVCGKEIDVHGVVMLEDGCVRHIGCRPPPHENTSGAGEGALRDPHHDDHRARVEEIREADQNDFVGVTPLTLIYWVRFLLSQITTMRQRGDLLATADRAAVQEIEDLEARIKELEGENHDTWTWAEMMKDALHDAPSPQEIIGEEWRETYADWFEGKISALEGKPKDQDQ